jgi:tRNA uridine 5-carboxymethylaminomethyl modification enzyme
MREALESQERLTIKQGTVEKLLVESGEVVGIMTSLGVSYGARAVIITTGTFLKGLIHIGLENFPAGRAGEFPSVGLSDSLRALGLSLGRLKTGTPPRLDARTIDFSKTEAQRGDDPPQPFSYSTKAITNPQLPCYITYTNRETHEVIRGGLDRSPLYGGRIKGIGPRYCPSIEDKVVRFAEKERHQVFLEPEGLRTTEYYANGISTSLPYDIQIRFVRTIAGLEHAEIMRPAYAIEYDFVFPTQLRHSLEVKGIDGLFLAGQINGTSGYEEAAAQGLMAGINAALKLKGKEPLVLGRDEAYIGVLIDDLVTRGTREPYRMFTSRAEYRLLLRHDNADMRLMEKGFTLGLVKEETHGAFLKKKEALGRELERLRSERLKASEELNSALASVGTAPLQVDSGLDKLLKRPEVRYSLIRKFCPSPEEVSPEVEGLVEIELKYEGYIQRQAEMADRLRRLESRRIPPGIDYAAIPGLSREIIGKLTEVRPETIGQASRIPGVTPAAVSILLVAVERAWKLSDRS